MKKKFLITWDNMQIYCRELAALQLPARQWRGIIGVSRGGLVPAAILARELGIRYVDTVCVSSYDHDHQRDVSFIKAPDHDGEGYLIVDDLVDSGNTAGKVREAYPKAKFVTVCAKPAGKSLVDSYVIDIDQGTWIEQPWDMSVAYVKPISSCKQK